MEKWGFCLKCKHAADDDSVLYCDKLKQHYDGKGVGDMTARSPICRVGGKFYLAGRIVRLFPEHRVYVEPFGGAMHVLFKKQPSEMEVYNDIDSLLVNFFNVVKHEPEELFNQLDFSLFSRESFLRAIDTMNEGTDVEKAGKFFVVNRQCFGGKMKTWNVDVRGTNGFFDWERRIREAHERLKNVFIENIDWRKVISKYDSDETLFYIDPPYMFNHMRSGCKFYDNEMSDKEHLELVERLKTISGKFLLSGYENTFYDVFERVDVGESSVNISKRTGVKRVKKPEYVWKNF